MRARAGTTWSFGETPCASTSLRGALATTCPPQPFGEGESNPVLPFVALDCFANARNDECWTWAPEGETRWRSMTVLGGASARWSGWRFAFVRGRPFPPRVRPKAACFGPCLGRLHRIGAPGQAPPKCQARHRSVTIWPSKRIPAFGSARARIRCLIRRKRPSPRQNRLNDTRKLL